MSKDEHRRNINKNTSGSTLRGKSGKSFAHLSQNSSPIGEVRRGTITPSTPTSHSQRVDVVEPPLPLRKRVISAQDKSSKNLGEGKKPSFMQKALKAAAMFALALGTTSLSMDSQAQASSNLLNIRGVSDVEQQVLEEQDKRRKFLTNKSGTKFTNKIVSTNILRISPEVLSAVQNSIGQRDGVMRDLALRASEATLAQGSHPEQDNVTLNLIQGLTPDANDGRFRNEFGMTDESKGEGYTVGINSIETIEVDSGIELGYATVNNLSEGEVAVVGDSRTNAGEGQTSYDNQTQMAGLLHSVRNDMSGYADTVIARSVSDAAIHNTNDNQTQMAGLLHSVRNDNNRHPKQDNVILNLIQDLTPNGYDTLPSPEFVNSQGSLTNSTLSHSRTLWARGIPTGYAVPADSPTGHVIWEESGSAVVPLDFDTSTGVGTGTISANENGVLHYYTYTYTRPDGGLNYGSGDKSLTIALPTSLGTGKDRYL